MNLKTFLEHFDTIAEAPGGIPKLRSLILDLAVRGKLVPQNPEDEPASVLFDKSKFQREQWIKAGKIRKSKQLPPISPEEVPYQPPQGWEWCRFSNVVFFQEGPGIRNWQFRTSGIKLLNVKNIVQGELVLNNSDKYISEEEFNQKYRHFLIEEGDLLFASSGNSWGKTAFFKDPGYRVIVNTSTIRMRFFVEQCSNQYLRYFLDSDLFKRQMQIQLQGIQPNFGSLHLTKVVIPLPPLAEQQRIVEKVDELMGLCDRLSSAKQTRDNLRQKLRESAIASLMNAETNKELDTAWAFVRDNWHNLSQHPEDIDSLRKIVLELAMRGKLTSQQEEDEPSHILLEKIKHKKEALDSKGKKDRKYKGLIVSSKSYTIPKNWKWVRWIDVGFCQNGKAFPSNDYSDRGIKLLRPGNLHVSGKIQWTQSNTKYLSTSYLEKYPEFIVGSNELIMNLTAQSLKDEFLGRVCLTDESEYCLLNQRLARIMPVGFLSEFCLIVFKSPLFRQFVDELNQGTLIQHMYTSQVNDFKFPFPPLAEQKRIVTKVNELMQLCDQLEASLRESQQRAESLAASAISHLTI